MTMDIAIRASRAPNVIAEKRILVETSGICLTDNATGNAVYGMIQLLERSTKCKLTTRQLNKVSVRNMLVHEGYKGRIL